MKMFGKSVWDSGDRNKVEVVEVETKENCSRQACGEKWVWPAKENTNWGLFQKAGTPTLRIAAISLHPVVQRISMDASVCCVLGDKWRVMDGAKRMLSGKKVNDWNDDGGVDALFVNALTTCMCAHWLCSPIYVALLAQDAFIYHYYCVLVYAAKGTWYSSFLYIFTWQLPLYTLSLHYRNFLFVKSNNDLLTISYRFQ